MNEVPLSERTTLNPRRGQLVMPTRRDDVSSEPVADHELDTLMAQAERWSVWAGNPGLGAHTFEDLTGDIEMESGAVQLDPTITSFYGHEIIAPAGVSLVEIRRFRRVRLVLVTLTRVAPGHTCRVLGWQGDNESIHLVSPLPGEDEYLGVYHAIVFGKRGRDDVARAENRAHYLRTIEHGASAVLDADVTQLDTRFTPGALRGPGLQA